MFTQPSFNLHIGRVPLVPRVYQALCWVVLGTM